MSKKIVFLPLDERPCNKMFPQYLFGDKEVSFTVMNDLGAKKTPADVDKIKEFLLEECKDAYGLVISMDMLLYGGLLPSRLHYLEKEVLVERANLLRELRKNNPEITIYAFQTIMRCPRYSSDDEEPDYYGLCGEEIYMTSVLLHKQELGIPFEEDLDEIRSRLVPGAYEDYTARRALNVEMDEYVLTLVDEGTIDTLVFPQDDCAHYGLAAIDQRRVLNKISELCLEDKVMMYPGADEVGMTLTARMLNKIHGTRPKVYVKYASEGAKSMIPGYEGNELAGTVRNHLFAAGCRTTDSYEAAEIILAVSATGGVMEEAANQPSKRHEYYAERNLNEFTEFMHDMSMEGKIVTLCDNAYSNGSDLALVRLLNKKNMLLELDGYSGWNTSSNTLGTAIAAGVAAMHQGKTQEHINFLTERYLEDAGYCSVVRGRLRKDLPSVTAQYPGTTGEFSENAEKWLYEFAQEYLSSIADGIKITHVSMPWKRTFEVELRAEYHGK